MSIKKIFLILFLAPISLCAVAQIKKKPSHKPVAAAAIVDKASVANGLIVFTQNCVSCHQADGGGVPHMNPPLIKTPWVLGDQTRLINIVLNGFKEDVEINGDRYSNVMPAFNYLKDQEIADVLTYVRNNFGNKASAVTVKKVTATRAAKSK
ncbi:c-type cytochrome [Mucilaginibacter sp.]|uniref:c-type cytochrome n=1 Tax=Mucilaginibacter sp. TaxID=1882438 RepID=UPI003B00C7B8